MCSYQVKVKGVGWKLLNTEVMIHFHIIKSFLQLGIIPGAKFCARKGKTSRDTRQHPYSYVNILIHHLIIWNWRCPELGEPSRYNEQQQWWGRSCVRGCLFNTRGNGTYRYRGETVRLSHGANTDKYKKTMWERTPLLLQLMDVDHGWFHFNNNKNGKWIFWSEML